MVVGGAGVLVALKTIEKRGVGIETEVVLEAMLDTIEKSAWGTAIVVAETAGVLSFEVGEDDMMLLLDIDVVPSLLALLIFEVEAIVTVLELAGVSDVEE